jgi:hypothetical protein
MDVNTGAQQDLLYPAARLLQALTKRDVCRCGGGDALSFLATLIKKLDFVVQLPNAA